LFGLTSRDLSLSRSSASRQLAPGGEILCILSVRGLHGAVFAIAGALDDGGKSGSTYLAAWCGVVGVPSRPGGLE
jgi:hypothetical protein